MPTQVLDQLPDRARHEFDRARSDAPAHDRTAAMVDREWVLEAIHRAGAARALNVVGLRDCVRLAARVDDRAEVTVMLCQHDTIPAARAVAGALDDLLHAGGCHRWRVELAVDDASAGAEILLVEWGRATS